jgi:serine protease AprX
MRRYILTVFFLTFILFMSIFSSLSISENTEVPLNQPEEGWWNHWIRDLDQNGIDDVLDDIMASNPGTTRTRVFIDYLNPPTQEDQDLLSAFDLEITYVYHIVDTICARNVLLSDIETISNLPGVVMVEYEVEVYGQMDVSGKAVKAVNSTEYSPYTVDDLGFLGTGISIAILDSGVDDGPAPAPPPYHLSLDDLDDVLTTDDPKFIAGVDVTHAVYITDGSYNPDDSYVPGHGTHVAGTAMGTSAGSDYRGVAPQARLVDVKVMERWGSGVMGEVIRGIEWCVDNMDEFGIRILSMSIGANYNSDGSDAASLAVNAAVDAGLIVVVAAGNGGANMIGPPASADKAIVVGAINDMGTVDRSDDQIWSSSNVGPRQDDGDEDHLDELKPDVVAPGVNIMAAKSGTSTIYASYSGTSMACPHVAGIIALMLEANPHLTPDMVKQILHDTAEMPDGVPPSTEYDDVYNYAWGWGMVDAYEAVMAALENDDRPPIISNINVNVNGLAATISWHTHKAANSIIEYGLSSTMLDEEYEDLNEYVFDHNVTINRYLGDDLEEETQYFFKIKGFDEQGNGPGESTILSFTTDIIPDTDPPWIYDVEWHVTDTSATILWQTNEPADSVVEYGLTIDYGFIEQDLTPREDHSLTLADLSPGTTYNFRVNSSDGSGNTNHSGNYIFTTDEQPDTTPPVIYSPVVTDITDTSANIVWDTDEASDSLVRYGKTLSYGNDVSNPALVYPTHVLLITGLSPSTEYYFQVQSADASGNTNVYGDEFTKFSTAGPVDDIFPSLIKGPEVTILTDTSATIEWETDEESEGMVEYGFTKSYGYEEPKTPSGEYVFIHNITLTDLFPASTYHYRVVYTDAAGNRNESDDYSFSTLPPMDKTPPILLSGPSMVFVGETKATIVWVTDELSDSEVFYGTSTSYGFQVTDTKPELDHEITLTDLEPGTTYHYMVKSTDSSGNSVESSDYEFTTKDISIPIEIEFLNIMEGDIVSGVIEVHVGVSAGSAVIDWVRYRVDNESWQNLDVESTTITIDTSKYSEGEHTLYVEASDGRTTVTEDVTFTVEHEPEVDEESWVWVMLFVILAVIIILILAAAYKAATRRGIQTAPAFVETEPALEVAMPVDVFSTTEGEGLSFITDEPEPVAMADTEVGISFVPDAPTLGDEPGISFIPSTDEISFNIGEEEQETLFASFETVRCPRCKSAFDADTSSKIECPDCGFSAGLRN